MAGWNHYGRFKEKECSACGKVFKPNSGSQKFCSKECGFSPGKYSTEEQYKSISGNWERYLSRLIYGAGRKREALSRDILLRVLQKQNYRCALSGIELTCQLSKGEKTFTNASVDRINPGGPYEESNIQLVCRGLNSWRSDTPLDQFIDMCRRVAEFNQERSEVKDGQA